MSKPVSVEWGLQFSLIITVMGFVLFFMGLSDILDWGIDMGGWGFWSGAVGVIMLLIGIIWSISIVQRMLRFRVLLAERSKAVFVRNLDEIEYTAWRLPSKYDRLVMQKKDEMGIR
jgi:membrane protein YdbS with pleckstrin-like domain